MASKDIQATNEELGRVMSLYSKRFGHPVGSYGPDCGWRRLTMEATIYLVEKALETGTPVKG